MVKTVEQAKRIQSKRAAAGKKGVAVAVRRFLNRMKLGITAIK